jgi:outer membrane receptor protein involved in Fe transport
MRKHVWRGAWSTPRPGRRAAGFAAVAGLGLLAQAAYAQTLVQDVIVTASKRQTKLLDAPLSVVVIEQAALTDSRADTFADVAKRAPALSYVDSGPGNKRYALRGLQSAGEPEVSLYYDEIPISGLPGGSLDTGDSQPDIKLWDVDRVEILLGPQGTLYGNGSMGGAIRVLSKRPVLDSFQASTLNSVGSTSGGSASWALNGMINLPLVKDRLALRVTGYDRHEGGWIDDLRQSDIALPQIAKNNLNWERTRGGRASLNVQVTPKWNVVAIGYHQDLHAGNASDLYPAFATADDRYVSKSFVRTPWRDRSWMGNVISTTDLGWAELTATASYQHRAAQRNLDTTRYLLSLSGCTEWTWNQTCSGSPIVPAVGWSREAVEAWSGEARLVSQRPGPLKWTLGAFVQDSTTHRLSDVAKVDANGYIAFDPVTGQAVNQLFSRTNRDTFDQYALFGETSYDLTRRLTAIVGLRWFDSRRTDAQTILQQFFPGSPIGLEPFQTFSQDKVFQKYELTYGLGRRGLLYVQAAQGFRAGGPNVPGGFTVSAPPYQADSVWDYETGWKLNLLDRRIFWTGAVYSIDWTNLQQLVPTAPFSHIANVGKARSDGVETSLAYSPVEGLSLTVSAAYTNARLVGPQPAQASPALQLQSGDRLANVPKLSASGALAYWRQFGAHRASVRLDGTYQSSRNSVVASLSPTFFVVKPSALLDLHLTLDSGKAWRWGLDATNLLDRYAPTSGKSQDANLAATQSAARPRTVSLSLALSY